MSDGLLPLSTRERDVAERVFWSEWARRGDSNAGLNAACAAVLWLRRDNRHATHDELSAMDAELRTEPEAGPARPTFPDGRLEMYARSLANERDQLRALLECIVNNRAGIAHKPACLCVRCEDLGKALAEARDFLDGPREVKP